MTRDNDRMIELRDRLQIARRGQGELFISLHADSLVSAPWVNGASVYTRSDPASDDASLRLASKAENRADSVAGADLSNQEDSVAELLVDLEQRDAYDQSVMLADLLVQELNGATNLAKRSRAQARFVVLTSSGIPSVLIELGYLSNPADEDALTDNGHVTGWPPRWPGRSIAISE